MKKLVTIAIAAVLCISNSFAQESKEKWSLRKCIEYGVENNINVQQYEVAKDNQEISLQTAKFSRLPSVNANLGQNLYIGRAQNREGVYQDKNASTSSFGASASMPIFAGFRINNQIKAGALELNAAMEDLNQAKENVSLQITGYYLQVLFAKELYKIAVTQLDLSKELVSRTQELVDAGKSPESELYDAQAGVAKEEMNVTDATNNLQIALLDLAQAINLQDVNGFDVVIPDVEEAILSQQGRFSNPEDIYNIYVTNKPAVKAAAYRVDESEKTMKIAQSAYYPSLSLGASYSNSYYYVHNLATGINNTSFADQLRQNGATSLGLSLSIPLFNKLATRNNVRSAKLGIRSKQLSLDQTKQELFKEVQQAWVNADGAYQKYVSSSKGVEASQKAFEFEEEKYLSGRSNTYQFSQVRARLASSLSEEARAKYEYLLRSKILDFYQGKPIIESFE